MNTTKIIERRIEHIPPWLYLSCLELEELAGQLDKESENIRLYLSLYGSPAESPPPSQPGQGEQAFPA